MEHEIYTLFFPEFGGSSIIRYIDILYRSAGNGGGTVPPLGFVFKLPKNGFSEAPQTSQVLRTLLWTNFSKNFFWSHDPLRTLWPLKKGSFSENCEFCGFLSIKCVFLPRNVSFRLFLALETLDQPKLAVWNKNFLWSHNMISERSTTVYHFRCYS